ncbi:MAG: response regulator, partial [Propionibacteriaceae bacterium]|nr:response regulator [Propionibacteriaceae bacterium]
MSGTIRVGLADDDSLSRMALSSILEHASGIDVAWTATNGQLALEAALADPVDVILMDVQMPVLDGITATRAIRALDDPRRARTPIIAITAHALRGDAERLVAAGMNAYLSKPIAGDELVDLVERLAAPAEVS